MIVNKAALSALFVALKTEFNKAFEGAPSQWQRIAMRVPSTTGQNDYKWIGKFPRMRKWIGEKQVKALAGASYTIVNDDWEATVEVDRNDIEDDNLGIYRIDAASVGESARQLPDEIVFDLVNNGFTNKCYDGKPFFSAIHKVGKTTVSNLGSTPLSAATLADAQASYGAARAAMREFKDEEGRPLGIRPNILLVPPALEDTANALMNNDRLEDGKPNPYKGTAEVVVGDWLTSDTAWFLLDTTRPVKPFIYQERKAPVFVSQTDLNADGVFMRKKFKFGAEARAAGGYGFWQLAYAGNS